MSLLSKVIENYNKESLNEDPTFEDNLNEDNIVTSMIPHVPGSDVCIISLSWSDMSGICSSNILQMENFRIVNSFEFDMAENYTTKTIMLVKINHLQPAGVLVSAINGETDECITFFEAK